MMDALLCVHFPKVADETLLEVNGQEHDLTSVSALVCKLEYNKEAMTAFQLYWESTYFRMPRLRLTTASPRT